MQPNEFKILRKAGSLRNGAERGAGTIWHAVKGEPHFGTAALCGNRPRIQWRAGEGTTGDLRQVPQADRRPAFNFAIRLL